METQMQDRKVTRKEREFQRHRQEILRVALKMFSESGFHGVTMQDIARESEFAIGTLYKFFENKEDLYKALILGQAEKFDEAFEQVINGPGDEIEKLRNYVRIKGEMFYGNLSFIRLYLAESRGASFNIRAGLDEELRTRYHHYLKRLASIISNGIKNKRFNNIADAYYLAVALDSAVNAFLLLSLDAPELYPYPDNPDVILNIFLKGLIGP
jgi:TetR/AcrR family transcriptional regulator